MKKIISFSLWGNNPKYTNGAIKNAKLRGKIYPDWTCRFYCASTVPSSVVSELELAGAEVVISEHPGDWTFTTERFRAIDDADVDLVIFRDADSRLNFRESAAVEEWVNTNKTLHIMRDHPHHGGFPILAGMWGLKKDGFKFNMSSLLQIHNCAEQYHYDQIFLQAYIWRFYESDCLVHDEFFGGLPFPSARIGTEYVGKPFEADDLPSLPQDEKYFI